MFCLHTPSADSPWLIRLKTCLEKALAEAKYTIIMGEFNTNLMNDDMCRQNIDYFQSNGMYQLIHKHIRVTDISNSIIDHAYVSNLDNIIQVNILKLGFSHHLTICLVIKRRFSGKSDYSMTYRLFKFFNEVIFVMISLTPHGTY